MDMFGEIAPTLPLALLTPVFRTRKLQMPATRRVPYPPRYVDMITD